jgi:glycosyltransferase 2 family protein
VGVTPAGPTGSGRSRWRTAAVVVAVLTFFGIALAARWRDVTARKWELDPGYLALATLVLAVSYAMVAALWAAALRRAAGLALAGGMRIWFASNLARYVPGNVWSFVGAVELARREGVPRRTTLAVMALAQLLSVGTALLVGLPALVAGEVRLAPAVALGGLAVAAAAVLAVALRQRVAALLRRRYPEVVPGELAPSPRFAGALAAGYGLYWVVTGLAFAGLIRSLRPLAAGEVPLAVAAFAAAYAVGFLALVTPAGLGVREGVLTLALAQAMPPGAALAVALLSRLWMMLVELAGAGLMQLLGRYRAARRPLADPNGPGSRPTPG